jgi:transcriptional regulator with XRE-family HTH domain
MNEPRLGAAYRALRRRKNWRQRDVGAVAGVSQSVISRIEAGRVDQMTLATLQATARALDASLVSELRWRGGALDKLMDERHAGLIGATVEMLDRHGWSAEVEVSYSHYGERGSIDVLGWRSDAAALLVVEVKTELVSIEATLRKLDEKVRIAPIVIATPRAQSGPDSVMAPRRPLIVGRLLVLPDTSTSRRRIARHGQVLGVALPLRGGDIRSWIRRPAGPAAGVILIQEQPDMRGPHAKRGAATPHRVRSPEPRTTERAAIGVRR